MWTDVVFYGPLNGTLDQVAFDERVQQMETQLGIPVDDFSLSTNSDSLSDYTSWRRGRQLFVSGQLDSSSCPENTSHAVVTVQLTTRNETVEKLFMQMLQTVDVLLVTITTSTGQAWHSCSNAVTRSQRLVISAPHPPPFPSPVPTLSADAVRWFSLCLILVAASCIVLCGSCGQRILGNILKGRVDKCDSLLA